MLDWLKRMVGLQTRPTPPRWTLPEGSPILTRDDLGNLIDRCGYQAARAEIMALAVPVFHIIAGSPAPNAPLGQTRLGGAPDLPLGSSWPLGPFGAASFLGQFDLQDVAARTGSDDLPPTGLLSLFILGMDGAGEPVEMLALLTPMGVPLQRLAPPEDASEFGDTGMGYLNPIDIAAFVPGLSIAPADVERLELTTRFPEQDELSFLYLLGLKPDGSIGEWLGRGVDNGDGDQRQVAHARRVGRPGLERFAFIADWAEWEQLKTISSRLQNGTIYRPWKDHDDPRVRWLLDNRAEFDAGTQTLQLLLRLESNRPMNLWINDADPIFIMVDQDRLAQGDLSEVHATVTQG